jgi:flagellar basal-body rod modification protein FlgD
MTPEDFINIMVTELQNQDPLDPTSPSDLLQETSEIGQLSSSDQLQTTMQSMTLQSQIGSASSLIGQNISGIDGSGNATTGVVNSVQVQSGSAYLQLDSGDTLSLSNVTAIGGAAATGTTSSPTPTSN